MANVESFGTEREDIKSSKFKSYKGKDGQTDRIGIIFANKKEMFKGTLVHYNEAAKKYYVCKSDKNGAKALCCTTLYKGNKPNWRIVAIVVIYHIQKVEGKDKVTGYEVLPWVFGNTVYNILKEIDKETPLDSHDLKLTCKNEQYQNITTTVCNNSIWRSNPALQQKILAEYPALIEDAKDNLGQDLNIEELKEVLGIETPGSQDAAADIAMGDVLESI